MKAREIANAIAKLVDHSGYSYERWTVGVTDNPSRRRNDHKQGGRNVSWWDHWDADTEEDARAVERYFLNKGMRGGTGGSGRADYVYVF